MIFYATGLLPGYKLPLGKLIDLANRWARKQK
jgi:hypothetical protein